MRTKDVLLYHGDARALLNRLPASSIKLTVTSPPYNIGKAYETVRPAGAYSDEANDVFNLDDVRDRNVKYPNRKKAGKLKWNTFGKNPSDVWEIPKVTSGANRSSTERTGHPAQFPLAPIDACWPVGLSWPFQSSSPIQPKRIDWIALNELSSVGSA